MAIFERENARVSSQIRLKARFAKNGILYDPEEFDRVEIWKFAEGEPNGGVLVDTVDGSNVIQQETGIYYILYDPFVEVGGSPAISPVVQGPGSPDDSGQTAIQPNVRYYDKWWYRTKLNASLTDSVGLTFFLYPDDYFVDADTEKYRFEMKPDRKLIVKGESLDIRLRIIPIPLYQQLRKPIIQYVLPILKLSVRVLDNQNREVISPFDARFNGKEGIVPTSAISALQVGMYLLEVTMNIPNGQTIVFRRLSFNVVD